jgi:hypothetical protein
MVRAHPPREALRPEPRQDNVDLDIADVSRAGADGELAQVVRRQHQ